MWDRQASKPNPNPDQHTHIHTYIHTPHHTTPHSPLQKGPRAGRRTLAGRQILPRRGAGAPPDLRAAEPVHRVRAGAAGGARGFTRGYQALPPGAVDVEWTPRHAPGWVFGMGYGMMKGIRTSPPVVCATLTPYKHTKSIEYTYINTGFLRAHPPTLPSARELVQTPDGGHFALDWYVRTYMWRIRFDSIRFDLIGPRPRRHSKAPT